MTAVASQSPREYRLVIEHDVGHRRLSRFWAAEGKPGLQEGLQKLNFGAV